MSVHLMGPTHNAPNPSVLRVGVKVVIDAEVTIPAAATDAEISAAVLAQVALLAPFAANVRAMHVTRQAVVGVIGS